MKVTIGIFALSSISTFGLLEVILLLQKDTRNIGKILAFRIITWFVGVGGLLSPLMIHRILVDGRVGFEYSLMFLVWAIVFNVYLFMRFFKNQSYADGKKSRPLGNKE